MNHAGYATLADSAGVSVRRASHFIRARTAKILGDRWTNWRPAAVTKLAQLNDYINFSDSAARKMVGKK